MLTRDQNNKQCVTLCKRSNTIGRYLFRTLGRETGIFTRNLFTTRRHRITQQLGTMKGFIRDTFSSLMFLQIEILYVTTTALQSDRELRNEQSWALLFFHQCPALTLFRDIVLDLQFSQKLVYLRIDGAEFRLGRASVSSYWVAIRKGISLGVFCRSLNSRYTIDLYASCHLIRSGCYEPYKVPI